MRHLLVALAAAHPTARRVIGVWGAALLLGCGGGEPPVVEEGVAIPDSPAIVVPSPGTPTTTTGVAIEDLVDPSLAEAVAGQDGWMYSRAAEADVDGDGAMERVVLTARVEMIRGRPAWDDGQPWQVYVEEAEGVRTYLYARYVQLGTVTMRIGLPDGERPATIILLEHVPDRVAFYEIVYEGPGDARGVTRIERMVDPTGELASPDLP